MPFIRPATQADAERIAATYDALLACEAARRATNWRPGVYPTIAVPRAHIAAGHMFVVDKAGEVVASMALNTCQAPEYASVPWRFPAARGPAPDSPGPDSAALESPGPDSPGPDLAAPDSPTHARPAHMSAAPALVIHALCVAPAHAGRGLGSCLLDFAKTVARARQLPAIRLDTSAGNAPALALYQKNGFTIAGAGPLFICPGLTHDSLFLEWPALPAPKPPAYAPGQPLPTPAQPRPFP